MTAEPALHTAAIRVDLGAIFATLELSKSTWLVTSLSPGSGLPPSGDPGLMLVHAGSDRYRRG